MDKPISLEERITPQNKAEIKKRIEKGTVQGLKRKTLDNAAAKAVLKEVDSFLRNGDTVFAVLMKVNGVLNRSFEQTGFDGGREPIKIFQRQFTSPGAF